MRERFREKIIETLDMRPLSRRQIAETLGVFPWTKEYWDFTSTLSAMSLPRISEKYRSKKTRASKDIVLDIALNRNAKPIEEGFIGQDAYIFFRLDQEAALVAKNILGPEKKVGVSLINFKPDETRKKLEQLGLTPGLMRAIKRAK